VPGPLIKEGNRNASVLFLQDKHAFDTRPSGSVLFDPRKNHKKSHLTLVDANGSDFALNENTPKKKKKGFRTLARLVRKDLNLFGRWGGHLLKEIKGGASFGPP